tara:strand:- start:170 stop:400 length:231 start_codon:yes stop_codon:yes gene_type:complete
MALNTVPTSNGVIGGRTWSIANTFLALPLEIDADSSVLAGFNTIASPVTWDADPATDQADLKKDAIIFSAYLKKKK